MLKKEFAFDKNYKSRDLYIYLVLIMHDQQLNVAGLNEQTPYKVPNYLWPVKYAEQNAKAVRFNLDPQTANGNTLKIEMSRLVDKEHKKRVLVLENSNLKLIGNRVRLHKASGGQNRE